eukprot:TRINITY_DN1241_c0_g1_i1.p1 TRINITY_DN1241_c0_g1~~TRINITY_DN1241_c0_g1_i1.p1  ORF type:complete len:941 (+),score=202.07 TRINITY_DN1241_c0_g1_i1:72-2894(+)
MECAAPWALCGAVAALALVAAALAAHYRRRAAAAAAALADCTALVGVVADGDFHELEQRLQTGPAAVRGALEHIARTLEAWEPFVPDYASSHPNEQEGEDSSGVGNIDLPHFVVDSEGVTNTEIPSTVTQSQSTAFRSTASNRSSTAKCSIRSSARDSHAAASEGELHRLSLLTGGSQASQSTPRRDTGVGASGRGPSGGTSFPNASPVTAPFGPLPPAAAGHHRLPDSVEKRDPRRATMEKLNTGTSECEHHAQLNGIEVPRPGCPPSSSPSCPPASSVMPPMISPGETTFAALNLPTRKRPMVRMWSFSSNASSAPTRPVSPRGSPVVTELRARNMSMVALHMRPPDSAASLGSPWDSICATVAEALSTFDNFQGSPILVGAEEVVGSWNALAACVMHTIRAARCALALSDAVRHVARSRAFVAFGVGASSGHAVAGVVGARKQGLAALGIPMTRSRLLARLGPSLDAAALCDESMHAVASSAVCMRLVDTVCFGDGSTADKHATALAYELLSHERPDNGYWAGFSALLSEDYEQAVTCFGDHLAEHPSDHAGRRLLRVSLGMQHDTDRPPGGYFRRWVGWEPLAVENVQLEEANDVGELVRAMSGRSVFTPRARTRFSYTPDDVLLRQQIEAARQARAVAPERLPPTSFEDQRGVRWHRSTHMLGKGAFGEVSLGMSCNAELVAVKVIRLPQPQAGAPARPRRRRAGSAQPGQEEQQVEELLREVSLMLELRHENAVSFLGSALSAGYILIVMEYCGGGSIQGILGKFGELPPQTAQRYTRDMLKGLEFLHSKDIVHRDLKPHNVLVTIEGVAKLADFGASAVLREAVGDQGVIGTPLYMAPEAARGAAAKPSDIWGGGVVVCLLTTGLLPWPSAREEDIFNPHVFLYRLANDPAFRPELPDQLQGAALRFVERCLQADPDSRPSAQELRRDVFLLH